jgi:iduronate 2-sulfatase
LTFRFVSEGRGRRAFDAGGKALYDLKNDPGEFTNLAENPEYSAQLERLKKQLQAKRREAGYSAGKYAKKKQK